MGTLLSSTLKSVRAMLRYTCGNTMSLLRRLSNLFARSRVDREISAELKSHIEMRIEDSIAEGMSPEDAHRDAVLRFGNPTGSESNDVGAPEARHSSPMSAPGAQCNNSLGRKSASSR